MRNFKYRTKRTSNFIPVGQPRAGERIPATMNTTVPQLNKLINQNTHFEMTCAADTKGKKCITKPQITTINGEKQCCYSSKYRNPILGYRKVLKLPSTINHVFDASGVQQKLKCPKDPTNTVYSDNYSKTCGKKTDGSVDKPSCYSNRPPTYTSYSRRGFTNPIYNKRYAQYLQRRVRTHDQQEFHFLSNKPLNNSTGNFATAAHNSTALSNIDIKLMTGKDISTNNIPDCNPNCGFGCGPRDTLVACDIQTVGVSPCDVRNNHAIVVYKRSNSKFSKQGAVSGGSRINRLKYQTVLRAQSVISKYDIVSKRKNTYGTLNSSRTPGGTNGDYPSSLYRSNGPEFKKNVNGICLSNKSRTSNGLLQRCKAESFDPPKNLTASIIINESKVKLMWDPPDHKGGSYIIGYQYNIGNTQWKPTAGTTTTQILFLEATQSYSIKLRAINPNGPSFPTENINFTLSEGLPSPPINLTTTPDISYVEVSWEKPELGFQSINGYQYNLGDKVTWISIPNNNQYCIKNLLANTVYNISIRAINSVGTGKETSYQIFTTANVPGQPLIVSQKHPYLYIVQQSDLSGIFVDWIAPFTPVTTPILDYEYDLYIENDCSNNWVSTNSTTSEHTITGISNANKLYNIRIRAKNSIGYSIPSNIVQIRSGFKNLKIRGLFQNSFSFEPNFLYQTGQDNADPSNNVTNNTSSFCWIHVSDSGGSFASTASLDFTPVPFGEWVDARITIPINFLRNNNTVWEYDEDESYERVYFNSLDSLNTIAIKRQDGENWHGTETVRAWLDFDCCLPPYPATPQFGFNERVDAPFPGPVDVSGNGIFTPWDEFISFHL